MIKKELKKVNKKIIYKFNFYTLERKSSIMSSASNFKIISISLFLGGWTDHNRPDPRHIIITLTQTQRLLTSITALCLRLKHNNDPEKAGKKIKIKIK